jgi:sulfite reductase (NADPH) hemoprotein beta-component
MDAAPSTSAELLSQNARLKYTIDRMGLAVFKTEVERRLGYSLQPARPFTFDRNVDDFGWATGEDGKHHFLLFIENGRVQDEPGCDFKSGLREIAKVHKGTFRLTANQHLMIAGIATEDVAAIKELLAKYKLDNLSHTALRLSSSACVAFPTCGAYYACECEELELTFSVGLAMAESERVSCVSRGRQYSLCKSVFQYLPLLIDKVEKICEENGLRNDAIVMRMTGCPNGCARPYVAGVLQAEDLVFVSLTQPFCRGRFCRQSSWRVRHAARWWFLRAEDEQDIQG